MQAEVSIHDITEIRTQVNNFPDCFSPFTSLRIEFLHTGTGSGTLSTSLVLFFRNPEEVLSFGQKLKETCDTLKPRETEVRR